MDLRFSRLRAATAPLCLLSGTPALAETTAEPAGEAQRKSYPAAYNGDAAAAPGGYALSRWAEDWRVMQNPAKRDDPLDRLKFIPLDDDGDVYLTVSGELRLRMNLTTNPNLRDAQAQRQDINRETLGADLHIGPHLRFYGEISHGGIGGRNLGVPAATLRNDMVLLQYFAEANAMVGEAEVGARYGRQEFTDGPNILVSQRDNNTIRYTLNGFRGWVRGAKARLTVFDLKPTAYGDLGTDDDVIDPARRFSGVTAGFVLPKTTLGGSQLYLDLFAWRRRNLVGTWGGRIGPATRYYAGAQLRGDVGRLGLDWSVNHQWGTFMNQGIDAWQAFLAQTWRIGNGPAKTAPRIGVHVDYASGGGGYGQGKLRNAYAPFGNNIYFSYQLYLTPSNLVAVTPNASFTPFRNARISAEYELAWRDDVHDAVYRANGQPFAGTQNGRGRKIADVVRAQMVWNATPRLTLTGRYEHLMARAALTDAGYRSSDFIAGWISYRF